MRIGLLLVVLLLFGGGCARKKEIDPATNMVSYDSADSKMNAAIEEAKKTLPGFIQRLPSLKPDQAIVKWAAPTSDGGAEHIWVGYLTYSGGWFEGKLINEPEKMPGKKLGDTVRFQSSEVSDWEILNAEGDRLDGGYTDKVIESDTGSAQNGGK